MHAAAGVIGPGWAIAHLGTITQTAACTLNPIDPCSCSGAWQAAVHLNHTACRWRQQHPCYSPLPDAPASPSPPVLHVQVVCVLPHIHGQDGCLALNNGGHRVGRLLHCQLAALVSNQPRPTGAKLGGTCRQDEDGRCTRGQVAVGATLKGHVAATSKYWLAGGTQFQVSAALQFS